MYGLCVDCPRPDWNLGLRDHSQTRSLYSVFSEERKYAPLLCQLHAATVMGGQGQLDKSSFDDFLYAFGVYSSILSTNEHHGRFCSRFVPSVE